MRFIHLPILLALTAPSSYGALVAYWNFNELAIAAASSPGSGDTPNAINADLGSGSLDLTTWAGTLDDFGGSATNSLNGDAAEESLSLIAGSGTAGNGSFITLQVSLVGRFNPSLSFASQGTATGFNSNQLAWSVDGSNYTNAGSPYDPADTYGLHSHDLSNIDALDGASTAYFRITFDGASGSSGNNRIDNLQINAIPEPSLLGLIGTASLLLLLLRRSRH